METRKEILISLQDGRTETDSSLRLPLRVVDRESEGVGRYLSQSQPRRSLFLLLKKPPLCTNSAPAAISVPSERYRARRAKMGA